MGKKMKSYLLYMKEQTSGNLSPEEKQALKAELLIRIGFFQHERLIHLIVTVTFALLAFLALVFNFLYENPASYLLLALLLVLLIPYIRHYYILENGVQKLYQYYDRLS
jgi:hypothetical protein